MVDASDTDIVMTEATDSDFQHPPGDIMDNTSDVDIRLASKQAELHFHSQLATGLVILLCLLIVFQACYKMSKSSGNPKLRLSWRIGLNRYASFLSSMLGTVAYTSMYNAVVYEEMNTLGDMSERAFTEAIVESISVFITFLIFGAVHFEKKNRVEEADMAFKSEHSHLEEELMSAVDGTLLNMMSVVGANFVCAWFAFIPNDHFRFVLMMLFIGLIAVEVVEFCELVLPEGSILRSILDLLGTVINQTVAWLVGYTSYELSLKLYYEVPPNVISLWMWFQTFFIGCIVLTVVSYVWSRIETGTGHPYCKNAKDLIVGIPLYSSGYILLQYCRETLALHGHYWFGVLWWLLAMPLAICTLENLLKTGSRVLEARACGSDLDIIRRAGIVERKVITSMCDLLGRTFAWMAGRLLLLEMAQSFTSQKPWVWVLLALCLQALALGLEEAKIRFGKPPEKID